MSGSNEKVQSVLIGKHAAYFRGKTRQNPEEILGVHVPAVGHELVGGGLGFSVLLWAGAATRRLVLTSEL